MEVAPRDPETGAAQETGAAAETGAVAEPPATFRRLPPGSLQNAAQWLHTTNHNPEVVGLIRRARRRLPGDPEFGDPLSTAGDGGPRVAARAADRLLRDRGGASREVSLGVLQLWQSLNEAVSRRPANPEVTLVFTDLVGFSTWALQAGDDAALTLLRRVAQAIEPPLLDAGGQIVKRLGDGLMAVFDDATDAVRSALAADRELRSVQVDGYTPRMRVGIHTGRPQRMASDWLGVDVNIAARVMERATKGGIMVSGATLDLVPGTELNELGVVAKRSRKSMFAPPPAGLPADLVIYRLKPGKELAVTDDSDEAESQA